MLEEILKKFAIDNAVGIMKSIVNYIKNYIIEMVSITPCKKYMINSCKRKHFNNIHLSNADIVYTFKDSDTSKDIVALDIEYFFDGVAIEKTNFLLLYYSMKEYNKNNISIEAYDCVDGSQKSVATEIWSKNNDKSFVDNGAYWKIPFYNRAPGHMDPIATKVVLSWKRFCPIGPKATRLIIDPRNYSKNINSLTITIKNESKNFDIEYIKLSEYNRKKKRIDKNGGEYDIYNIKNKSDKSELVKEKQLLNNGVNENNLFIMEVKF